MWRGCLVPLSGLYVVGSCPWALYPQSGDLATPMSYYVYDISGASRFLWKQTLPGRKKTGSNGSKVMNLQKKKKKKGGGGGGWGRSRVGAKFKPAMWRVRETCVIYVIAGKSRVKHRKSVQYTMTDWIKHSSVACCYPSFSACAVLRRGELCPLVASEADSQHWIWICVSRGQDIRWLLWLISMMIFPDQQANKIILERVRHKPPTFHIFYH